jgi:uncharacterized membrane protein YeaQ/YmgE (transglycosylase-associated protein family)
MQALLPILIQVLAGAVGGNAAGKASTDLDQGWLINSIAGLIGGGIGGQCVMAVMPTLMAGGAMSTTGIITSLASGFVGGGVLLAILSLVKKMMASR